MIFFPTEHLEKIEWLNLENNPYIDDWCLDRLTGYFKDSLTYLNLNGCENVTEKGIASLSRLQKLKNLHLGGHLRAQNLELVCVMLEELLPELRIQGVSYCDQSLLDNSSSQK